MKKFTLGFIAVVIVGAAAYMLYDKVSFGSDLTTTGTTPLDVAANPASSFITTLLSLQSIKLDTDIFHAPAFGLLTDNTIPLVLPDNIGRTNPFAPIGSETTAKAPVKK